MRAAVLYLTKDGKYETWEFNVQTFLLKKGMPAARVAAMILAGDDMDGIIMKEPAFALDHLRNMRDFSAHVTASRKRATLAPKKRLLAVYPQRICQLTQDQLAPHRRLCEWLTENLIYSDDDRRVGNVPLRPQRTKQLYLAGCTGIGKSYLIHALEEFVQVYIHPMTEQFHATWSDQFDVILFEEFACQHPMTYMNRVLEGYPVEFKVKGAAPFIVDARRPVIILSNRLDCDLYKDADVRTRAAFLNRVEVIDFGEHPIRVDFESEDLPPAAVASCPFDLPVATAGSGAAPTADPAAPVSDAAATSEDDE